jgi:hypothetical protein
MLQEIGARLVAERRDVDGGPVRITACRTGRVDAADEASEPFERRCVLEFRRATAAARKDGEPEAVEFVQRPPARLERGHDRDLVRVQLRREGVLLEDLRIAPARGAIELGDDGGSFLQPDLIDAVLVAVERQEPAVASQAQRVHGVQHDVRCEPGIGMRVVRHAGFYRNSFNYWAFCATPEGEGAAA